MLAGTLESWLDSEWLLADGRGGFASSTIIACPTRREHGWLVGTLPGPRLDRWMLWSHTAENIQVDGRTFLLANFEFNTAVDPHGYRHLTRVEVFDDGPLPRVEWHYALGPVQVRRILCLPPGRHQVVVRYEIVGRPNSDIRFQAWPLIACRPLSALRRKCAGELFDMVREGSALGLRYRLDPRVTFAIVPRSVQGSDDVAFNARGDWWYNFRYRREAERGLEFGEDLMVPGSFTASGSGTLELELVGKAGPWEAAALAAIRLEPPLDIATATRDGPRHSRAAWVGVEEAAWVSPAGRPPPDVDEQLDRLGRTFVILQPRSDAHTRTGLVAGYPWLVEYCRDACIALAGILLKPRRFAEARDLLLHMALLRRDGALPSLIIENPGEHDCVGADVSLWFIHAVDGYLTASGDTGPARTELLKASLDIVRALAAGQRPGMRVDDAGLLVCDNAALAATWMDARHAWQFITPRTGRPVEINALWYNALRVLAQRLATDNPNAAADCEAMAARAGEAFGAAFLCADTGGLYDVVSEHGADASVRPNQILAVSLPHSPLSPARQQAVLQCVERQLLTPAGLRTLAPDDPNYHGRYEGSSEQRERAAHQGSVYPWLFGPFIDAYLRVHGEAPAVLARARGFLAPLVERALAPGAWPAIHELYDGDPPHAPRGCLTQAWCVAEVSRAWGRTSSRSGAAAAPGRTDIGMIAAPTPAASTP